MVSNLVAFSSNFVLGNRLFMQGCSYSVAIDSICLSMKSYTVTTDNKSITSSVFHSDSDCGDESEMDDESLQEVYEKMSTQWLNMCASN